VKFWAWFVLLAVAVVGCHLCSPRDAKPSRQTTAASSAVPVPPGVIPLSPTNTSITFTGSTTITSHSGHFEAFEGTLEATSNDPKDMRIHVVVDMDSTTTKIGLLTKHLKSDDFFDVARYPKSEFALEGITPSSDAGSTKCRANSPFTACNSTWYSQPASPSPPRRSRLTRQ